MTATKAQTIEMDGVVGSTHSAAIVDLPRLQEGSSPQHLLVTLLGDYWLSRKEHLLERHPLARLA